MNKILIALLILSTSFYILDIYRAKKFLKGLKEMYAPEDGKTRDVQELLIFLKEFVYKNHFSKETIKPKEIVTFLYQRELIKGNEMLILYVWLTKELDKFLKSKSGRGMEEKHITPCQWWKIIEEGRKDG